MNPDALSRLLQTIGLPVPLLYHSKLSLSAPFYAISIQARSQ